MSNGRSLHDSSKGFGPTRSLQRGIDRERPAQQSRNLGRQETCLVGTTQPARLARQRQNQTHPSRVDQTHQTVETISRWDGAPGGAVGDEEEREEEEEEEEEEGDLVTEPVEQWLKRMIKGTLPATKPHTTTPASVKKKKGQPSTSGSEIPVPKSKAGTSLTSQEEKDLTQRLEALRERRKTLEKNFRSQSLG